MRSVFRLRGLQEVGRDSCSRRHCDGSEIAQEAAGSPGKWGEERRDRRPENSGRTQVEAAASGPAGAVSPRGRPAWDCPRVPEGRCRSALSLLLPGGSGGGRDPRVPFPVRPGPQSPGPPAVPDAAGPPGSSRVTDADEAAWAPPVPSLLLQGRPSWACGGPGSKQAARLGSCSCVRPRCPRRPGRPGTSGDVRGRHAEARTRRPGVPHVRSFTLVPVVLSHKSA